MVSDPSTSLNGCRVALLSCGQFDPPSYAHLRMFERSRDFLVRTMGCKVVEGIMSVSADSPTTCTPAKHRLRMVETAVRRNFWIRAGDFECSQRTPVRQIAVLKHYQKKLSQKHDEPIRVLYVCGSEVLDELVSIKPNTPPLWTHNEIRELLQRHGLIVLKRGRTHPSQTIYLTDILRQYQKNIYVIEDETFPNDLRCSRIRTALRRGESVKYCLDDDVIEYIIENNLYRTSPDYDYDQCVSGISTASAPNLSTSCRAGRSTDEVPPEPPQRSSSEKLSEKYKSSMIPPAEWRTPPTSQPSSSESCSSSRETSEPRQLPLKSSCHSVRDPSTSERYSVKWSDALDPFEKATKHEPVEEDYAPIRKPSNPEQDPNQLTVIVPAKETVTATFSLQPRANDQKDDGLEGIPPELPKAAFMKPILSQPQPAADSPLFNETTTTDCDAIPNCVISSVTTEACRETLRTFTDSPSYDNVTLDDLLAASTSWAEYLHKESERIDGIKNDDSKDSAVPNDPPPTKNTSPSGKNHSASKAPSSSAEKPPHKEKEKKKGGWFFNRSKSMKDLKPQKEDETLIRICATDRREQPQTSPEILWRKINQTIEKERWSDLPPSPKPQNYCLRHPEKRFDKQRKEAANSKSIRFDVTKSAENIRHVDARPQTNGRVATGEKPSTTAAPPSMTQSNYEGVTQSEDGITLRFRRYKLSSTPETTV
uniref:CTP_transf_like domain-containing protein n=1 Tax=Haemonchus contortus TaxID=6289 RepID=A0A7I4XZ71_HAECO